MINVESELGKGTAFKIYLPIAGVVGSIASTLESANDQGAHRSLKILLVDGEPKGRSVITEYLEADGPSVVIARDGAGRFDSFQSRDLDGVVTDWETPGINGDRLASAVKSHEPDTPLVLFTGFGNLMNPEL